MQRYAKKEDAKAEDAEDGSMSEDGSKDFLSSSDEEEMEPAGVAEIA